MCVDVRMEKKEMFDKCMFPSPSFLHPKDVSQPVWPTMCGAPLPSTLLFLPFSPSVQVAQEHENVS